MGEHRTLWVSEGTAPASRDLRVAGFPGNSHFLDKSGFWVRKDVALIPAQSTVWAIEVDSQVSIISFHRHTYILDCGNVKGVTMPNTGIFIVSFFLSI